MSTAISRAIYNRVTGIEVLTGDTLAAQQTLATLLVTDPETNRPACFMSSMNRELGLLQTPPVAQAIITFRPGASRKDGRIADGESSDDSIYDVEIWSNYTSGTLITDIADCLERMFDAGRGALPFADQARQHIFWSEVFVPVQLIPDDKLNGWVGLARYRFVEIRY